MDASFTDEVRHSNPSLCPAFQGPCFQHQVGGACWRNEELQSLIEVYESCAQVDGRDAENKPLVLIQGPSGSGKSTLVEVFQKRVQQAAPVAFLRLRHEKSSTWGLCHPHEAMLKGLLEFSENLIRNESQKELLDRLRKKQSSLNDRYINKLANDIPLLAEVFCDPTTVNFSDNSPPNSIKGMEDIDGLSSQFRFDFQEFVRFLSDPSIPLVVVLEDLQWASEAIMDVMSSILRDVTHHGVMIVGVYDDDKELRYDSLLCEWSKYPGVAINKIILTHCHDESGIQTLLSRILGPMTDMESLTECVYEGSHGSILGIDQLLSGFEQRGILRRENGSRKWIFEQASNEGSDNIHKRIRSLILSLPQDMAGICHFIACYGNSCDPTFLSYLGSEEQVTQVVQRLIDAGIVLEDQSTKSITFAHAFCRDAIYHMHSEEDRAYLHYRLARVMWTEIDVADLARGNAVCFIVDHFQVGKRFMKSSRERSAVVRLCLTAVQFSVKMAAFLSSSSYLQFGLELLGDRSWHNDYDLSLELHNSIAEIELCRSEFNAIDKHVDEIIDNARCNADSIRARTVAVYKMGTVGSINEAVHRGCKLLSELGVILPLRPSVISAQKALVKTRALLRGKSDGFIDRLPPMQDPDKLAALKLLCIIFSFCFSLNPRLAPLIAYETIRLTLDFGVCSISSVGFVLYGAMICRIPGRAIEGYRCGKVALSIQKRFFIDIWSGRVSAIFYAGVNGWRNPLKEGLGKIENAERSLLLVGDKDFAMRIANVNITIQLDITPLPELVRKIRKTRATMRFYGHHHNLSLAAPIMYILQQLSGRTDSHFEEFVEASSEMLARDKVLLQQSGRKKVPVESGTAQWAIYSQMMICYLFGKYEEAFRHSQRCAELLRHPVGAGDTSSPLLFDGLTNLALARKSKGLKRRFHIQTAKKRLRWIKNFAEIAPFNFLGKAYLLEAELSVVNRDSKSAHSLYAVSVCLYKEGGFFMGAALSNERAGKYFLEMGDLEMASKYLREAIARYKLYGAEAKAQHLRNELASDGRRLV